MTTTHEMHPTAAIHTRRSAAIFRAKSFLLQIARLYRNTADGNLRKGKMSDRLFSAPILAESKTRLWIEDDPAERVLTAGKIQNLRLAAREIDGLEFAAGEIFSFWKNVGRTSRFRGFVEGRELREGCIIPNVGGGLCQLSNALYDAALKANFDIVERHAHTQVIAGSLAESNRDATVFWNYVDLRFRSPSSFRIEAKLSDDHLIVKFVGETVTAKQLNQLTRLKTNLTEPNLCVACGVDACSRSVMPRGQADFGKTAFLVDEFTPEFDAYIQANKKASDEAFLPLNGRRFRRANYAWTTAGFGRTHQSLLFTALRSYRSRRLAMQGAARQENLLAMSRKLAESYGSRLGFDVLHVVVQQEFLPFLWRSGHLGGRTFDVLMTALPMAELQKRLDDAHKLHPNSRTLGDFRANPELIAAETEALKNARKIITPHTAITSLFSEKAELLKWKSPQLQPRVRRDNHQPVIVFPASTVGRKGCYELREALRGLEVTLLTMGPNIEDADFWQGVDAERAGDDWLEIADLVVLPAFVEHRPRRLLRAASVGIPVIASTACGIENIENITAIVEGNADNVRQAITSSLSFST